ncbi:MAG: hypothetical protein QM757_14825 [Paludibaculum sp.]
MQRHPPGGLLHPLVAAELAEAVLLRRVVVRLERFLAQRLEGEERAERRVGPLPVALVEHVARHRQVRVAGVDAVHELELGLVLRDAADEHEDVRRPGGVLGDPHHLVVHLGGEAGRVVPGGGEPDHERLRPGAHGGALRRPEVAVGLGEDLVDHDAVRVAAELALGVGRDDVVERRRGLVVDPPRGLVEAEPAPSAVGDLVAVERRRQDPHAVDDHGDLAGLLRVLRGAVDLGAFLVVGDQQVQHDARRELAFAVLPAELDPGDRVLADVAPAGLVPADRAEQRPDDQVLLPVLEHERLAGPLALRVDQDLGEEVDDLLSARPAVVVAVLDATVVAPGEAALRQSRR